MVGDEANGGHSYDVENVETKFVQDLNVLIMTSHYEAKLKLGVFKIEPNQVLKKTEGLRFGLIFFFPNSMLRFSLQFNT